LLIVPAVGAGCALIKSFETPKKALHYGNLLPFLTPLSLERDFSRILRVANGRDTLTADAAGAIFGGRLTTRMRHELPPANFPAIGAARIGISGEPGSSA
jgi:hypothetical protein